MLAVSLNSVKHIILPVSPKNSIQYIYPTYFPAKNIKDMYASCIKQTYTNWLPHWDM